MQTKLFAASELFPEFFNQGFFDMKLGICPSNSKVHVLEFKDAVYFFEIKDVFFTNCGTVVVWGWLSDGKEPNGRFSNAGFEITLKSFLDSELKIGNT